MGTPPDAGGRRRTYQRLTKIRRASGFKFFDRGRPGAVWGRFFTQIDSKGRPLACGP